MAIGDIDCGAANVPSPLPGITVTAFCDGSVKILDENIDAVVYSRLLTPAGTKMSR